MHRHLLQAKLKQYQPADANERQMLAQISAFVAEQPNCFERTLTPGHITGSAWIINLERTHVLLTHHAKLDRWLQLGGHSDGDPDTLAVALREGREESGLQELRPVTETIFDVDVHLIPARRDELAHYHYDVRFLLEADSATPLVISAESKDLAWVALVDLPDRVDEESLLRMMRKS
ncbi:MAG: NUDIX hydrolase [Halothiobacillaceae bacterium]|nr:MAG: NUDIX hydrolase [Halothiobacillaceae bacterium]